MKIDTYTKVLLTGIFLFLGVIAFDLKPDIEAQAGIMGGNEIILNSSTSVWHLKDGKLRKCTSYTSGIKCSTAPSWND